MTYGPDAGEWWDDRDDDYDSYLDDPGEQAAAEDRALERHIEEQAAEEYWQHRDEMHGGGECDCPLPEWPEPAPCRLLFRLPRWSPRKGWRVGTPGACDVTGYRSLRAALRVHRSEHLPPF